MDNRKGQFDQNSEQNAVSASYKHHPLLPVYDIAGNFAGSRGLNLGNNNAPFARISRNHDDRSKRIRAFGSVYAEAKIADKIIKFENIDIELKDLFNKYGYKER